MSSSPARPVPRARVVAVVSVAVVTAVALALAAVALVRSARDDASPSAGPPVAVPDSDYDVPDDAVFLAVGGDDDADGGEDAPVATLERALALVRDGGTVVVRAGTYRDGSVESVRKTVTLQAYPHEQVWFDGTDVTAGWRETDDGHWVLDEWSTPEFCDGDYYDQPYDDQREDNTGPCTHVDMGGGDANPAAGSPQMLFLDGEPVREVTSRDDVEEGRFFYDQEERRVFLGSDPRGRLVEMAARPIALRLEGGEGGSRVRGLGFRRYATNEYNGNATHGAVLSNEPGNVFERNAFTQMAGAGLSVADSREVVVRGNRFVGNGFNGLDANGSSTRDGRDDMLVEDNVFEGNNAEVFGEDCSLSCAAAGAKLAHMSGLTVRGNLFAGTREGNGFWCDLDCSRAVITGNVFRGNEESGLYYEVSSDGVIADNLMIDNGNYGLKSGSADMEIYHNTLVGNGTNVLLYDDDRSPGVDGWDDVGPDTTDNDFSSNVLAGGDPPFSVWRTSEEGSNTGPGTILAAMDYNTYHRPSDEPGTLVDWRGRDEKIAFRSLEEFREATGLERRGQDLVDDDPFVDREKGDFRIHPDSPAADSARPLPEEVAQVLDLPAGSVHDRGALTHDRWQDG